MTVYIIIITVIVSIIAFERQDINERLVLNPYIIDKRNQWYRFISSGFIHMDWLHLIFNMLVLYSFGGTVEEFYKFHFGAMGPFLYILMYLVSMVLADVSTFYKYRNHPGYSALGASGAVSGVLFASILFLPLYDICLYGILCIPGIILGPAYLIYSSYAAKKGHGNVNHDAHFYGAIVGVLFTLAIKPSIILDFFSQIKAVFA